MMKRTFWICLALLAVTIAQAQTDTPVRLNISSFNLRMDNPGDGENAWPHRKERVKQLIQFHELDLIGTQEGFKHQLDGILELQGYAYVGGGRDDGKDAGEHSAIIYRTSRLMLLDHGDFWFSETPDLPGKGWDATCCNRICSWAQLKDNQSGRSFFIFNVHYDHQGKEARRNSSLLLNEKVKEIAGNNPVVVTGDFNATPDSEPIQIILDAGQLHDSYRITRTPPYGTEGTFNAFRLDAPMRDRIDYIWVSPHITVHKYGVLNEQQYGRFPSDHFPVMIEAEL
ncbi:MAG: endonuclease/exonuclease/phosphatase family protein [Proteiniphilum sp.]|jgi:endonuclease/exonuclease/phosphatase family metal-dependent hydrolase|nr:endonuclease/exonuclease/phosphatase family protein [Proteiniphilum sp.]MDD3331823.1 endonuclease/exonuclease/phosphatase family protein [Proteiniphilum sp.]MDD3555016.1 endonuclease/exonuclease/phosphatase family protein [Proteiniphilum sp.]MDD4485262.1 endonuclease/exonuclease/phosphatase family protein [Proteiniphilum sp.]MDY0181720.1 endonuclease/exonuclease/phosphatase family protein [Proteiniphilum sp.]